MKKITDIKQMLPNLIYRKVYNKHIRYFRILSNPTKQEFSTWWYISVKRLNEVGISSGDVHRMSDIQVLIKQGVVYSDPSNSPLYKILNWNKSEI